MSSQGFAGTLKGVGKVYIQTVLDCFSRYVRARLYTSKMPVTAVPILNNHVLPFFDEHGVKVETILSDNGREFCGREDRNPYELFLQLEEIEHRKTKVGPPQSNGFIERFHRTLSGRAPQGEGAHDLVRVGRRDADRSRRLPRDLQPEPPAPRPRHRRADAVPGLQEGDPEAPEPEEVNRKRGEDPQPEALTSRGRVSRDYCTCTSGGSVKNAGKRTRQHLRSQDPGRYGQHGLVS